MIRVMLPQSYLPKAYCWAGRSIQCATVIRDDVDAFMAKHKAMRVFSGLRRLSGGDHRCGCATDLVPLNFDDYASAKRAYNDAVALQKAGKVAYVEPLSMTWTAKNHHVHISWRRCPPSLVRHLLSRILGR